MTCRLHRANLGFVHGVLLSFGYLKYSVNCFGIIIRVRECIITSLP